ncbi:MAG: hypothetical protein AABY26_01615 [Nanoarchaeota archaeon]
MKVNPKSAEKSPKKKKRKIWGNHWELEPNSDFPVHEKYTKEELVKK